MPKFKDLVTAAFSAVAKLWKFKVSQQGTSRPALRSFKHSNGSCGALKFSICYPRLTSNVVEDYPEGYPQLAAFIASADNFSIFRKFDRASNRVLLHLQSEIAALDKGLDEMDQADERSTTAYRLRSIRHEEGWDNGQRKLISQLQEKLPIYCDTPFLFLGDLADREIS